MPKNRNWIWFFAALVVLGAASVSINWAYNVRQQLTMEQLNRNQDLWDKNGPADYDLLVDKTYRSLGDGEDRQDRFEIQVRKKKVTAATMNGRSLEKRLWDQYDLPGWMDFVESFVKKDTAPNAPRTFRTAQFDPKTGQLLHFTRSVSTTRERVELFLRVTPTTQ